MRKRDNDFVDLILDLADEHASRDEGLTTLHAAVAEKFAAAESEAKASGSPFNRADSRWAIRRVLFQPSLWPELTPHQGNVRRAALERLLDLCKG